MLTSLPAGSICLGVAVSSHNSTSWLAPKHIAITSHNSTSWLAPKYISACTHCGTTAGLTHTTCHIPFLKPYLSGPDDPDLA
jgi:hypothetical protein